MANVLAVNESSPAVRFSWDHRVLVGIWQGKGKPPFKQDLNLFCEEMNSMREVGFHIGIDNEQLEVKLDVVVSTVDFPAKAAIMNMFLFNGLQACVTCGNQER